MKKSVQFPISAKLTLITVVLSLLFLPVIIALGAWLTNVRDIARENNRTLNEWAAQAIECELESVRSGAVSLLRIIGETDSAVADGIAERFFTLHPTIKAVFAFSDIPQTTGDPSGIAELPEARDASEPRLFVSNTAETIGRENVTMWFESQKEAIRRALSGEILIRNAAAGVTQGAESFFDVSLLVMIFPYKSGAETTAAAVIFSPENLARSFGTGGDASFMIQEAGDAPLPVGKEGGPEYLSFIQQQPPEHGNRSFTFTYSDDEGAERFVAIKKAAINHRKAEHENNVTVITTVKTARVFEKISAVVRLMCCIGGGALILSLIFVQLYANTISKPLLALIHAADSVREGDYAVKLANRSGDEIGELTQSFISMTHGVAYVEQFANKTAVRLARQGAPIHSEKTVATLCFVKLRAFADLTGNASARDTAALASEFFSCLTRRIARTGGVVDKFLTYDGVALLAFWGVLEDGASEWNAMNCIHAALMMRASLQKLNHERSLRIQCVPLIKMSCVVNTGEALAGIISADERDGRKELLVASEAARLAGRIVDANEDFDTDILIMEHTWELIGERLVLEETPLIKVKGREKPLRAFALVNVQSDNEADAILQEADMENMRLWVGVAGPRTMAGVRERWQISL
ncbi:MAG: HAMP domain-containing protein [Treponema sp.]|jgi:adenylate cyclase|nr:HAMP domain-containing protein [Treponema sp.]